MYNGEIYDARLDRPHWDEANFDDPLSLWISPEILPSPLNLSLLGQYSFQDMPPIRVGAKVKPISVSIPFDGVHIVDVGENMVGWCRIRFHGASGISVQIRHAEILNPPIVSTR